MLIRERYAAAIRSKNLKSEPRTIYSDTDVLGAMGIAGKANPLGVAVARLLAGDKRAALLVIEVLAPKAISYAWQARRLAIQRVEADDICRMTLAWYLDSACKPCGGTGYRKIEGTPALSAAQCHSCRGTGHRDFDASFPADRLAIAKWAAAEMERELAFAGPMAMRALASRLDL